MVRKASGGFAAKPGSQIYREYKDYNPKDVDERTEVSFRGSPISRSGKTPAQWAAELTTKGGKSTGDIFKIGNKLYKITSGHRGAVGADEVTK